MTKIDRALAAYREHVAESHHEYERATVLDFELSELIGAELLKGVDSGKDETHCDAA